MYGDEELSDFPRCRVLETNQQLSMISGLYLLELNLICKQKMNSDRFFSKPTLFHLDLHFVSTTRTTGVGRKVYMWMQGGWKEKEVERKVCVPFLF